MVTQQDSCTPYPVGQGPSHPFVLDGETEALSSSSKRGPSVACPTCVLVRGPPRSGVLSLPTSWAREARVRSKLAWQGVGDEGGRSVATAVLAPAAFHQDHTGRPSHRRLSVVLTEHGPVRILAHKASQGRGGGGCHSSMALRPSRTSQ